MWPWEPFAAAAATPPPARNHPSPSLLTLLPDRRPMRCSGGAGVVAAAAVQHQCLGVLSFGSPAPPLLSAGQKCKRCRARHSPTCSRPRAGRMACSSGGPGCRTWWRCRCEWVWGCWHRCEALARTRLQALHTCNKRIPACPLAPPSFLSQAHLLLPASVGPGESDQQCFEHDGQPGKARPLQLWAVRLERLTAPTNAPAALSLSARSAAASA